MKIAMIDFETTGLDRDKDQITDGAALVEDFFKEEELGLWKHQSISWYESLNDPGMPIPEEVVNLTGITNAMVAGQKFDWETFWGVASQGEIIVAHNMEFDESFFQQVPPDQVHKFACTKDMIPWKERGYPCRILSHLILDLYGPTRNPALTAHRAMADCHNLSHLLFAEFEDGRHVWQVLVDRKAQPWYMLKAFGAPYPKKDMLKAAGFLWNPGAKVWEKKIIESEKPAALELMAKVYPGRPTYQLQPIS